MDKHNIMIRDLGSGLIMRHATSEDTEALATFNAHVHSDQGWDSPDEHFRVWIHDLMTNPPPGFKPDDFTLVEDTKRNKIVSSMNLIPQTWCYAGVELPVGRPELVGTHPDYRCRGLVRAQFEIIHQWSTTYGHTMQAITGIPWYYRQFGYEMALELYGSRQGSISDVPTLKEGTSEPYQVHPARNADLDFITTTYHQGFQRYLMHCARDRDMWQYEINGRTEESSEKHAFRIIKTEGGEAVGFIVHPTRLWGKALYLLLYELKPGISWWAVTPSVLRYLKATGAEYRPYFETEAPSDFKHLMFALGSDHPVYDIVAARLPKVQEPYAWYIRVPDLPAFLHRIAPVLEERLAASALVGHSGTLRLNFYREGLALKLENGHITTIDIWDPKVDEHDENIANANFPNLTFLQLLFGYRSFSELDHTFADCYANHEARLLLDILFPKQASNVWPIS